MDMPVVHYHPDPIARHRIIAGILSVFLAIVAALVPRGAAAAGTVPLDVEFKLTDVDYNPLAGVPLRLVLGAENWQAPESGVQIVTAPDGTAKFTTQAVVGRRWQFSNIGFTPFSMPFRSDHIAIAAELTFAIPKKDSDDIVHHWLYTADIDCDSGGDCSTDDLDKVYEAGADGRFTKLVGSNASGPNFNTMVDGWMHSSAGYKLWDFALSPVDDAGAGKRWHLKLGIMRLPKPVLR
jgi:hypothetical protein